MAFTFVSISRALTKKRDIAFVKSLESKLSFLRPTDWLVAGSLFVVMCVSLAGILWSLSSSISVEVPARGGTLIEGVIGSPRFVNPMLALSDTDRDLVELLYSGLLKANSDGTLSPDIAASYSVSEDFKTYTFTIKEDALFHDGTRVTARDVAFTVLAAQNPEIKSPRRANWEGVEVSVVDDATVTFVLKEPYAPFLENTTLGILPSHIWSGVTPDEFSFTSYNTEPIGSGPYMVASIKRTGSGVPSEYRLRAFEEGVRTPFITNFVVKFYSNAEALRDALNHGDIESAHSLVPDDVTARVREQEVIFGRVFAVFFNQNENKIFADTAVRRALNEQLDKYSIIDTVLDGYGSPIDGPLPPETIENGVDRITADDRLARSRAILEDAGWKLGEDGVYSKTANKQTTRLSFSISTASVPELKRAAEMVADSWRALGAEVELKFFEQNDLNVGVLRPRSYQALLFGLVVGRDQDLFAFWHSSQRNDPGLNVALYANIDVDALLERVRLEPEFTVRMEKRSEAAKIISDETAAIFLYVPHFLYLIPEKVQGVSLGTMVNPSDRLISVDEWYVSTDYVWPLFTETSYFNS